MQIGGADNFGSKMRLTKALLPSLLNTLLRLSGRYAQCMVVTGDIFMLGRWLEKLSALL